MDVRELDTFVIQAPLAQLERTQIEEFLLLRGHDFSTVASLPEAERHALLKDASLHASARLAEIEARSHYVHEIHGEPGSR
jgi:hypothetical protein